MSAKNVENAEERKFSLAKQNDVGLVQCTAAAETAAVDGTAALVVAPERTNASGESRTTTAPLVPTSATATVTTMMVDENDSASGNKLDIALASTAAGGAGLAMMSPGSGGGERADASSERQGGSDGSDKNNSSKRKTRRGKTKRGKRSSSSRPYSKSQWKFHVPLLRTAANKRRAKVSLGSAGLISTKDPFLLSDQPPLVPYNTNRFLMEDHMPHVLTPSEDEEEFLTKEFASVYEDARSERLEGLSKSQLIQEYLQLEANYEQVTRRYNAVKSLSIREENESAVNAATAMTTKDATEGGPTVPPPVAADRRRLEDRIRELTAENLELRRQLEHASRIGMVLSAKSSPRNYGSNVMVERMDSSSCHGSSSEDSESDSSSSTSSSSSDNEGDNNNGNGDSSSSSMSDDDDDEVAQLVGGGAGAVDDREPLVAMEGPDELPVPMMEANGYHHRRRADHQNGLLLADDEEELSDGDEEGPVSPLSAHSINSPPPPPLVMN